VLCPNKSIAENFYEELCAAFGDTRVGFFGDGKKQIKDITVGIAQSVNNHVDKFVKHGLGLVIIDEVHHVPADTFFTIAKSLSSVGRMFGLTATDFRSDGKDVMIQAGVGEVLIKRDIVWGIQNNWLAFPTIIMRNVETTGREYPEDKIKNYKAHVLNSDEMNHRLIQDIQKCLDAGKFVLCLVDEKEHGRMLSEKLGLPFATGDDKQSKEYVKQLNASIIPGLIGTDSMVGEGTDTKNVDVLILANFVASKGPLWQNLGRGLRRQGTKTQVLVLDYRPTGSKMLSRHADQRLKLYKTIPCNIKEI
jgi:superfamily II DNA or RNA helicase